MNCPYCGSEMKEGVISGNGRSKVCWKEGDDPSTPLERLRGKGELENVYYYASFPAGFQIGAVYCESCELMMFKTGISH